MSYFHDILSKATTVLGTQAEAEQWLIRIHPSLNGKAPIELLGTKNGYEEVLALLRGLRWGYEYDQP